MWRAVEVNGGQIFFFGIPFPNLNFCPFPTIVPSLNFSPISVEMYQFQNIRKDDGIKLTGYFPVKALRGTKEKSK